MQRALIAALLVTLFSGLAAADSLTDTGGTMACRTVNRKTRGRCTETSRVDSVQTCES